MNDLQPLKFHRILVPVDESRPSHNSLAVAAGDSQGVGGYSGAGTRNRNGLWAEP